LHLSISLDPLDPGILEPKIRLGEKPEFQMIIKCTMMSRGRNNETESH